jgi:hypothetical protein
MSDFATIAAEITAGVLNTHPSTSALIKAAMVRQLGNLLPEIVPFMERSGSFSTVAGKGTYAPGDIGFPAGFLRFERIGYDMGSYFRPLEVVDMATIRALQESPSPEYPFRIAWWEERLQFAPAPNGAYVVKWDVTLDATKDTATGKLFDATDTSPAAGGRTNAWFLLPQVTAFKHLVWGDYYLTSPDQRPDMAQSHQALAQVALERLREAGRKRQSFSGGALVVPNAYDAYGSGSRSLRVSTLFPGAPV